MEKSSTDGDLCDCAIQIIEALPTKHHIKGVLVPLEILFLLLPLHHLDVVYVLLFHLSLRNSLQPFLTTPNLLLPIKKSK